VVAVYFGTKFCLFSRLKWSESGGGTNNIGIPRTVISARGRGWTRPPVFTPMALAVICGRHGHGLWPSGLGPSWWWLLNPITVVIFMVIMVVVVVID